MLVLSASVQVSHAYLVKTYIHDVQCQSYPPVERDGGSAPAPFPHETSMSSVSCSSMRDPFVNASHSMKQFDLHGFPSIVTFCSGSVKDLVSPSNLVYTHTDLDKDMSSSPVHWIALESFRDNGSRGVEHRVVEGYLR